MKSYIGNGKVFCTAGVSTFTILPNGDVFRCSADYNHNRPPMFNVLDSKWDIPQTPQICTHDRCDINCDIVDNQKFIFEKNNNDEFICTKTLVNFVYPEYDSPIRAFSYQGIDKQKYKIAKITWIPSHKCNFNCFYCDFGDKKKIANNEIRCSKPELTTPQWMTALKKFYEMFDWGIFGIAGGEPMLHNATLPAIKMMTKKFFCQLVTNMSTNIFALSRYDVECGDDKLYPFGALKTGFSISASLHLTAKNFNTELFKGGVLLIKNRGYPIGVTLVAHPLQMFLAADWKEWCEKHDIAFGVYPWNGSDHDGNFANLTKNEEQYLNQFLRPAWRTEQLDTNTDLDEAEKNKELTCEQKELLGDIPRYQTQALFMKRWNYKFSGLPSILNITRENLHIKLSGSIQNLSDVIFDSNDSSRPFKVGGRLSPIDGGAVLREFRAPLANVLAFGESYDFIMLLDFSSLPQGHYRLELDVVKEHDFWLAQKGVKPFNITIINE